MSNAEIDFTAPATLRKWPSLNGKHNLNAEFLDAYLVFDGTLDQCVREFMSKPAQSLYVIHSKPQSPLVTEVIGLELITELARLRDFL